MTDPFHQQKDASYGHNRLNDVFEPLTEEDREAIMFNLHATPPLPSGPTALLVERYEATILCLEAVAESYRLRLAAAEEWIEDTKWWIEEEAVVPSDAAIRAIGKACRIIETADERNLFNDGPAGGFPPQMDLTEWRDLYVTLDQARKL